MFTCEYVLLKPCEEVYSTHTHTLSLQQLMI